MSDAPGRAGGRGPAFWIGLTLGWAVMAYALRGAFADSAATNPPRLVWWVLGAAVAHDALVAPAVTTVGAVLAARAPRWWGGPVSLALALSGVLCLFSYPMLRRYGHHRLNPSALPHDYGRNLAVVLAAVWLVAAAVIARRATARHRTP